MVSKVKQEDIIELSSSGSSSDSVDEAMTPVRSASTKIRSFDDEERGLPLKKPKIEPCIALPLGFLDPLSPEGTPPQPLTIAAVPPPPMTAKNCKQFWKAGDYEGPADKPSSLSIGMDHVRVHPKFLHSNATSHKWALGALAELLDNSLDEACNGATYVNIDVLQNQKDGSRMLLVEDDGGGMDPDKLRQCMSLGYSMKSKSENTIGQYGNGFKTSTMRLGADVIVFSRCRCGKEKQSPTQSIGILSYTFLRCTGKDDIVVPMIDYEKVADDWKRMKRSTLDLWNKNLETILKWSPYFTEAELLQQLSTMTDHGTRIVIYNLWEDDQGELELDFETDKHDIQIRGVNRDEKKIRMAHQFPNSRHFLTYRHSLRSYASILYLRLPPGFRMILRGKEIEHHNLVDDMMLVQEKAYRPQTVGDGIQKDQTVVAVLMLGFVKDAKDHMDIQGFNVYHKNRLIKPFWRVWNAAGSDGRGVIGVLEANFVEPAHDKQDFERTPVLTRLEARLMKIQKAYWASNCHQIGYAPRHSKKVINGSVDTESSPQAPRHNKNLINESVDKGISPQAPRHNKNLINESVDKESFPEAPRHNKKLRHESVDKEVSPEAPIQLSFLNAMKDASQSSFASPVEKSQDSGIDSTQKSLHVESAYPSHSSPCLVHNGTERVLASNGDAGIDQSATRSNSKNVRGHVLASNGDAGIDQSATRSNSKATSVVDNGNRDSIKGLDVILKQLTDENRTLKCRMEKLQKSMLHELQNEREQNKFLREQLDIADRSMEELNKEQEALIDIFSEERSRRDREEENLRKKLKEASAIIQHLTEKSSSSQNHIKTENRGDVENLFQQTKN